MRFKSVYITACSGSVGGMTFAHNAGGMYARARATPTDPGTQYQNAIRSAVAGLTNHWLNTLTADQREAWNTYAANVPLLDVFGDPRFRSGINHYVRSNVPRLQIGKARVDDGPTTFNLGEYTAPWWTASAATQQISSFFTATDDWVSEDGAYMIYWASRPQNPSINFFKGPYRKYSYSAGNAGDPPTPPEISNAPFAFAEGNHLFMKANVSRADGRLGTVYRGFCLAAA